MQSLYTLEFVLESLNPSSKTLVEVGCGNGDLAAALQQRGYRVLALDHDQEAVDQARAQGVQAECVDWQEWQGEAVDGILFTRSLHHIHDLDAAMANIQKYLKPGGQVLIEDFAFSETDAATAEWLKDHIKHFAVYHGAPVADSFAEKVLNTDPAMDAWDHDHHHIHSAAEMEAGLKPLDPFLIVRSCPYLFRYFIDGFAIDDKAQVRQLMGTEQAAIAAGDIRAIGRRYQLQI